jgi:hypothetical protein
VIFSHTVFIKHNHFGSFLEWWELKAIEWWLPI